MYYELVKKIAENGIQNNPPKDGDYYDENGVLFCGKCRTPKQKKIAPFGEEFLVAVPCKCETEEMEKAAVEAKRKERYEKVMRLSRNSLLGDKFSGVTFDTCTVNNGNVKPFEICRRYATNFGKMLEQNQGLLLYGDCGTGKSHVAACICNHLMQDLRPVYATSFVKLLDEKADIPSVLEQMGKCDLVLLDDLGAERDTPYAQEIVYNLVDGRYRQNKPMIITTNMSLKEIQNAQDIRVRRIYQRILECCYPVHFGGQPFRLKEARRRYDEMAKLLGD